MSEVAAEPVEKPPVRSRKARRNDDPDAENQRELERGKEQSRQDDMAIKRREEAAVMILRITIGQLLLCLSYPVVWHSIDDTNPHTWYVKWDYDLRNPNASTTLTPAPRNGEQIVVKWCVPHDLCEQRDLKKAKLYSLLGIPVGFLCFVINNFAACEYSKSGLVIAMAWQVLLTIAGVIGLGFHTYHAADRYGKKHILRTQLRSTATPQDRREEMKHDPPSQTLQYTLPVDIVLIGLWIAGAYFTVILRKILKTTENLHDSLIQELNTRGDPMSGTT